MSPSLHIVKKVTNYDTVRDRQIYTLLGIISLFTFLFIFGPCIAIRGIAITKLSWQILPVIYFI